MAVVTFSNVFKVAYPLTSSKEQQSKITNYF